MKILTCGNKKFKKMVKMSIERIEHFGYEPIIYDLGDLNIGKDYRVDPTDFERTNEGKTPLANTFKPGMIKDCIENVKDNDLVVYLDADALLLDKIDELDTDDYDIAVTVRSESEVKRFMNHEFMGLINSGVVVFRKTEATMKFIDVWVEETKNCLTDQVSLNSLVREYVDLNKLNQVVEKNGVRIKLLTTMKYNNYYSDFSMAKIRHYKGNIKKSFIL